MIVSIDGNSIKGDKQQAKGFDKSCYNRGFVPTHLDRLKFIKSFFLYLT